VSKFLGVLGFFCGFLVFQFEEREKERALQDGVNTRISGLNELFLSLDERNLIIIEAVLFTGI